MQVHGETSFHEGSTPQSLAPIPSARDHQDDASSLLYDRDTHLRDWPSHTCWMMSLRRWVLDLGSCKVQSHQIVSAIRTRLPVQAAWC